MKFGRKDIRERTVRFSRHPRTRKIAIWCVAVILAIGVLFGIAAPPLLRYVLSNKLTQQLHRDVSIETIRINPYAMTATIYGFLVKEREGSAAAVSFDQLHVNLEMESLFRLGPVLKRIQLAKPTINLIRDENGAYNFQDLIDEFTSGPPGEGGPTPRFSLNNIEITDGKITFDDRPEKTKHEITEIRLGVPFISSIPSFAEIKVQPSFYAVVNGAPLQLGGETLPFKETRDSAFRLEIKNFQFAKYLEYVPVKLNFTVPSGRIDGHVSAAFKVANDKAALSLSGDLALAELVVQEKNEAPFLKLETLNVALGDVEVFAGAARLKAIKARGLDLHLTRTRDGALNVSTLVESPPRSAAPPPAKDTKPFSYRVDEIRLDSAVLHFTDETFARPYNARLDNVRLAVEGLSNEPGQKANVELSFDTAANEKFHHAGTLQLTPLLAEGKLDLEALRLNPLRPYYDNVLAAEIKNGFVDLSTRYSFEAKPDQPAVKLTDVNAALRDVRLEMADQPEPLWRIASLAVKEGNIDVAAKTLTLGAVEIRDGNGYVQRDRDGNLSYARLIKTDSGKPPPEKPAPAKGDAEWKIEAKRITLDRFRLNYDDRASKTPLKLSVSDLSLRADDFSNAKNHRAKATLRARINNKGLLTLGGTVSANPVIVNFNVDGRDIDLMPFQPTFADQVNFVLTGGRVGTKGKLAFDGSASGPAKLAYDGSVQIRDFATLEKVGDGELLKWKSLNLDGVQFASQPMSLRINEITLADFYSRLVLGADGKMNLQKLTPEKPEANEPVETAPEPAGETPATKQAERPITIGKINLQRGNVYFSDFFIKPNYSANLTGFDGVISELKPEAPGDIAIQAKLDNAAPVEIRGKINPLGKELYLDIAADAKEIEMSPFTPYSVKYVGYGIQKGKLSFNVKYKLENRKLDAQNQIILNQLTFGERVESPTATKLPVLLAVALLKDRNGVIDVNLPVSGSLDDPQFSVGGIVLRLVMNLITRAVTAPFTLIASMFGGGGSGEELSFVEFDYGSAALSGAAEAKIKTIANAMTNRPALKLEISARVDPVNDLEGLRKLTLERKIKAQKLKELARRGAAPASVDEVQIGAEEYERYLKAAYGAENFPKPRNVIGLAKELPRAEMEALILKHIQLSDDDLRDLAQRRADAVRDRLFSTGQIGSDRVFMVAAKTGAADGKARSSRVDFSVR
jgi:uncharacterized protein involved in outer membrane biogenesis